MGNLTSHLNLLKPDDNDYYNIQDFNKNLDIIDEQMNILNTNLNAKQEKINVSNDSLLKMSSSGIVSASESDYLKDNTGIWTPVLQSYDNGNWPEFRYKERRGRYVKTGSLVNCFFDMRLESVPNINASFIVLRGLPYPPVSSWFNGCSIVLWGHFSSGAFSTKSYGFDGDLEPAYLKFRYVNNEGYKHLAIPKDLGEINNFYLRGNLTYTIN